jgi:hypothetical protein
MAMHDSLTGRGDFRLPRRPISSEEHQALM